MDTNKFTFWPKLSSICLLQQPRSQVLSRSVGTGRREPWERGSLLQLNLSTTATLGTETSGHCGEVAVVERSKQEWMYGLSAKIMAIVERWPLVEVPLYSVTGAWEKEVRKKTGWWPTFQLVLCTLQFYRKSPQSVTRPARRKKKNYLVI